VCTLAGSASLGIGTAQAADLAAKAPAVEYVRVCSAFGTGFFYVPGTEACLRVGGRVRADFLYGEPYTRANDSIGFRARGRLQADARAATEYGLVRAFVRYEITQSSGAPFNSANGTTVVSTNVNQAYVQFGGLTAGKVASLFSNSDLPTAHFGTLRYDDVPDVTVLAYTVFFAEGFSATLSIEDGLVRRVNSSPITGTPLIPGFTGAFTPTLGGQTVPDIVGNLNYTGSWGTVQLAGAVHQIRDVGVAGGRRNPFNDALLPAFADTEYGWAVQLQAGVNLPFIAKGDAAWLAPGYGRGAPSYAGFGGNAGLGEVVTLGVADAVVNPFTGEFGKPAIWNVAGGFTHYWTQAVSTSLFGSYANVNYPSNASFTTTSLANAGYVDFSEWRVGGNAIWSPVTALIIGLEIIYAELDFRSPVPEREGGPYAFVNRLGRQGSAVEGRFRIQRDF
jgi:hypothetical protein